MIQRILFSRGYCLTFFRTKTYCKGGVLESYWSKVENKEITEDFSQLKVADELENLRDKLKNYTGKKSSLMTKIFGGEEVEVPKGLYLHGSVGCGKTMLMDLFHERCPLNKKRRTHYHSFMLEVHTRIHDYKKRTLKPGKSSKKNLDYDPIAPVAASICSDTLMLCLDEFQVTDIGDAMILKRLFTEIFNNGTILFATSNRAPDDLYKNGLQRSNFIPFIAVLKKFCYPMLLDSGMDYRTKFATSSQRTFFVFSECNADRELDEAFKLLANRENDVIRPRTLTIKNRNVTLNVTCGHIADCTFDELCNRPLGAIDYLVIGQVYHTVLIRNIPQLTRKQKSQARRFITLIDTFYDNKVRVVCSSEVPLKKLFMSTVTNPLHFEDENRALMDDLNISKGSENATASIFSGEEEVFAFDRTVSRLTEMQTKEYWKLRINT